MTENYNTQENKYDAYREDLCPPDKIVEWFVKYYGEEHRSQIEEMVKDTKVVFLPKNILYQDVLMAFKKVYKNISIADIHSETKRLMLSLKNLSKNEHNQQDAECFHQHARVLTELGIDVRKILLKGKETGRLKVADNEEVEKLKNRVEYSVNKTEVDRNVFNPYSFESFYRTAFWIFNQSQEYIYGGIKFYHSEEINQYNIKDSKDLKAKQTVFKNIAKMKPLDSQDIQFLQDFIDSKGSLDQMGDGYSEYLVRGINRLFNKNYTSMRDLVEDESLSFFLTLRSDISEKLEQMIQASNVNKNDFVLGEESEQYYGEASSYMINNPNVAACQDPRNNTIVIPIGEATATEDILHEYNHSLSFTKPATGGFAKHSRGFNEIVDEFLTQGIIEGVDDDSIYLRRDDCQYTSGIKFMEKFLKLYEKKLKECQLGDAPKLLKDFIGEKNYSNLIKIANELEENNYGRFTVEIAAENGIKMVNINEWLDEFEKDPTILERSPRHYKMEMYHNMRKFLNELVEHYKDFERGEIVDIDLDLLDMNSIQNAYDQAMNTARSLDVDQD